MGHVGLHGVRIAVGGRTLLRDVNFDALPGELVAIVGANGVGKTSLLRAIAGFTQPAEGTITLDGTPVRKLATRERARAVTLIGSDAETPHGTTVREVVATGRFAFAAWWDWSQRDGDSAIEDAALERVGLMQLASRRFDTLSSGERQRAWLALALAQDARLVLLDEPTSHLDPRYALETLCLMRGIAAETTTAFVVLHDLNEAAAIADRIALLGENRLLTFAPPADAFEPHMLERAFGITFDRIAHNGSIRVFPRGYSSSARF